MKLNRTLTTAIVALAATVGGLGATVTAASAATGDCVTVYGSSGSSSSGTARVCLRSFGSSNGSAKLEVTSQSRNSAPNNVYVAAGFNFCGYNTGTSRLGKNAPGGYTKTIDTNAANPCGVIVRLCYDKTLATDPCYATKVIYG